MTTWNGFGEPEQSADFRAEVRAMETLFKLDPSLKAAINDGTVRLGENARGMMTIIPARVSKHYTPVHSEKEIESLDKQKQDLFDMINRHPVLHTALDDGWARVSFSEEGTLQLELNHKADVDVFKSYKPRHGTTARAATPRETVNNDVPLIDSCGF
jgi:hypothetical protein